MPKLYGSFHHHQAQLLDFLTFIFAIKKFNLIIRDFYTYYLKIIKLLVMMLDKIFPKLHQEGYKFLVISLIVTLILWSISGFLGFISALITIWIYYFFRDPERKSIGDENYLVSPADGIVSSIVEVKVLLSLPYKIINILELVFL